MSTRALHLSAMAFALTGGAAAQSFSFPTFPTSTNLALNGNASVGSGILTLTPNAPSQKGSAYYDTAVAVAGGFTTTFDFRISNDGADGFTFIVQNDPRTTAALSEDGTSLGYSDYQGGTTTAIANSLVVEFDTWDSGPSAGDTSANEISVHTDGVNGNRFEEAYSLGNVTPLIDMSDGNPHTVRIDYVPGTLTVYLDDLTTPVLTVAYDFANGGTHLPGTTAGGLNLVGGNSAYVGFTGTTGGVTEVHEILSWEFAPLSLGIPYCPGVVNSTGVGGALAADGSALAADNDVTLEVSDLPANSFGFFLTSQTQGMVMNPGGSTGNLCLGGAIGRYVGPGQIQNSGANGSFSLTIDLTQTPTPTGLVQITGGQTWNFQGWYRDSGPSGATSNFTNGLEVGFL